MRMIVIADKPTYRYQSGVAECIGDDALIDNADDENRVYEDTFCFV